MNEKNTRLVQTILPDLYAESLNLCRLEAWFLRWEEHLPKEALEELVPILVALDDELMD